MIKCAGIQVLDATSLLNVPTPTHPPQGMNSFGRFPSGTVAALDTAPHAMTRRQQQQQQQLPTHSKLGNPSVS